MKNGFSRIAGGSEFCGNVVTAGRVRIDGVVRGRVKAASVCLGGRAVLRGSVRTRDIDIGGSVEGDVIATGAFVLRTGGALIGDVYRNYLQMLSAALRPRAADVRTG